MEAIIVLGIGNQLMMDDGIGIYLVEELAKQNSQPSLQYIIGESDIDYCLQCIESVSSVILVDAVCLGKDPGDVTIFPLEELHEQQPINISPHNMHLFHVLFHKKEEIKGFLIGIEPYEISFNFGLSSTLLENWNLIYEEVKASIETLIKQLQE
ncbi:hydrogenase maturation protease [Alkalihalobacterium elongatum]|uniref:hydrogenase maturation protease n=1 Tax=Alkalihalobacterium elongatum TaxID=2675466 RepID=UPI001C1FEF3A|nr:hydrogenase maturation protease [Alkalihalobacterium elongatum]